MYALSQALFGAGGGLGGIRHFHMTQSVDDPAALSDLVLALGIAEVLAAAGAGVILAVARFRAGGGLGFGLIQRVLMELPGQNGIGPVFHMGKHAAQLGGKGRVGHLGSRLGRARSGGCSARAAARQVEAVGGLVRGAGVDAADIGRAGDGAHIEAVLRHRQVVGRGAGIDAGHQLGAGDAAGVVAILDGAGLRPAAGNAGHGLLAGDMGRVEAAVDGVGADGVAHQAADKALIDCRHGAGDTQILDGGGTDIAKEALVVIGGVDIQIRDHMAIAVKGALECLGAADADGRPAIAVQGDVPGQTGAVSGTGTGIDLLGEPRQLCGGGYLIHAVAVGLDLRDGLAVPGGLIRRTQGNGDGLAAVIGAAHGEHTVFPDAAVGLHQVGVGAEAQAVNAVLSGLLSAVGILENEPVVRSAGDGEVHRREGHSRHGNVNVAQVLEGKGDRDRVEVGPHAHVGHVVHGAKGIGRRIHGAEHIAVGGGDDGGILPLLEGNVLGDGKGDGGGIHLLVLAGGARDLLAGQGIAGIEGGGVEDAGDLVDGAVQAVKGDTHGRAGHHGLAGIGDILHMYIDPGHLDQLIAVLADRVRHADDDGAAVIVGGIVHGLQGDGIGAVRRRDGGEIGHGAHHGLAIGQAEGVLHLDGVRGGEGQGGLGIAAQVVPGVIDIIPAGQAAVGGEIAVEGHVGHGAAQLVGHHHEGHAVGIGGGIVAGVGLIVAGVHVHGIVADGEDAGAAVGGDVRPVVAGVAAVHLIAGDLGGIIHKGDVRGAGELVPDEVRLHHDVAGVGIDQLPHAVGTDALGAAAQGLGAGGTDKDLQVRLIALDGLSAQLGEIVAELIGIAAGEVEAHARAGGEGVQPAAPGHIHVLGVGETPGVVAVLLGHGVDGGLGAVVLIGPVHDGLLLGGVEVVELEVQAEIRRLRHGDGQLNDLVDLQRLGLDAVSGREGAVDGLVEDVVVRVGGIHIGVEQAGIAAGIEQRGVIGVIAADIGRAHGGVALHDGAGHAHRVVLRTEVGAADHLAGGVDRQQAQVDVRAAGQGAVHVAVGGQLDLHAAQGNVIGLGLRVPAEALVDIPAALYRGILHVIGALFIHVALGRVLICGELAVEERNGVIVVGNGVAVFIRAQAGIELDDGILAAVGAVVLISAQVEGGVEVQVLRQVHRQLQVPVIALVGGGVGLDDLAIFVILVALGIEAVVIDAGLVLRQGDGGGAEQRTGKAQLLAPGIAAVGGALVEIVGLGAAHGAGAGDIELVAVGVEEDLPVLQVAEQIRGAHHHLVLHVLHALDQAGGAVEFLAAGIADAVVVCIRVRGLLPFNHQVAGGRGQAGGFAAVHLHAHQVVGAGGELAGVDLKVPVHGLRNRGRRGDPLPILVEADIGDGIVLANGEEGIRSAVTDGLGAVFQAREAQGAALLDGEGLRRQLAAGCSDAAEGTLCIEVPIAEHGHIHGVTIGEQHVVRRGTPAGAHEGIAMVTVVHEVLVMTPEVLHVGAGSAAGILQRGVLLVIDVGIAQDVADAHVEWIAEKLIPGRAGAALRLRQAQIVPLQQVDEQVHGGGPLDHLRAHIGTLAVLGGIAVEVLQAIAAQVEIGHRHLQVGQRCLVLVRAQNGYTVAGNGHIYRDLIRRGLVVIILLIVGDLTGGDGDVQRDVGGGAVAAAPGRDGGGVFALRGTGEVIHAVLNGRGGFVGAVVGDGIAEAVPLAVREHVLQLQLILRALGHLHGLLLGRRDVSALGKCRRNEREEHHDHQKQ